MATTREDTSIMQGQLDPLNWPVALGSFSMLPWLNWLWANWPSPTTIYMVVTVLFMVFQMADKLGLLERFKRAKTRSTDDAA